MLSFWEKIQHPFTGPEVSCLAPATYPFPHVCGATAFWRYSWQTDLMAQPVHEFYCEQHALEHGLSNYEAIRGIPNVVAMDLSVLELQAQETLIPYGGHPEDHIFENEAEASEDEKEVE